jgi:GAF domain-containing protein
MVGGDDEGRVRVVWAEGDAEVREHVTRLLRERFDVTAVENGRLALEAARTHPPDAILAAVTMPDLDGLGLLREIRADRRLRGLPVIIVFAHAGEEAHVKRWDEGADDYVVHPFEARELLRRVDVQVARTRAQTPRRGPRARLVDELAGAETLQRISAELMPQRTLEALYGRLLEGAMTLLHADFASLQMLDRNGTRLRLLASLHFHPLTEASWRQVDSGGVTTCSLALARRSRVVVPDVERCDLLGPGDLAEYRRSGARAVQSTPLFGRDGRPLGVLSTHWRDIHASNESELGRFDVLARRAADLIERAHAEAALRASEDRRSFLARLAETLAPLAEPAAIEAEAMRVLGEKLGVQRAQYWGAEGDGAHLLGWAAYENGLTGFPARVRLSDFGAHLSAELAEGRMLSASDVEADPRLRESDRAAYRALGFRAYVAIPLAKGGRLLALLGLYRREAHEWTDEELDLARETAERTWAVVERARVELALRATEARARLALGAAGMGSFVWYPEQGGAEPDARMLALFGLPAGATLDPRAELAQRIHPLDRERYAAAVARSLEPSSGGALHEDIRLVLDDGRERWVTILAQTDFEGTPRRPARMAGVAVDITERRAVEDRAAAIAARDAFLVRLADTLRPLTDPMRIQSEAARVLGDHLGADRAFYAEVDADETAIIGADHLARGVASAVGRHPLHVFGAPPARTLRAGTTLVYDDVARVEGLSDAEREAYRQLGIAAQVKVPLVKGGRFMAFLGVHQATPRAWTRDEVAMIEETAERTWAIVERAKAEAALRESETLLARQEERQTFLLALADALRPLGDVADIERAATRSVGDALGVDRVLHASVEADGDTAVVRHDHVRGIPSGVGRYAISAFAAKLVPAWRAGQTTRVEDVLADPRFTDAERAAYASVSSRAAVVVPLVKRGRLAALFAVNHSTPRVWSDEEVTLLEETAERMWAAAERARAEDELRRSDERTRALLVEATAARALAESANRAKDEFLATLSHELRTPLAAILLWAGALRSGAVPVGDLSRAVDAIDASALSSRAWSRICWTSRGWPRASSRSRPRRRTSAG